MCMCTQDLRQFRLRSAISIFAKFKYSKHFCKFKRRLRAMLIQAETT